MGLTRITSDGITDGTITGTDLATNLDLVDNQKLRLGNGQDLLIFHDGTNSSIQNGTGTLRLRGDSIKLNNNAASENYLVATANGSVELYYDNSVKLATINGGISVTGGVNTTGASSFNGDIFFGDSTKAIFGDGSDLQIYHDGSDSYIKHNGTGNFYVQTTEASVEDLYLQAGNDVYIRVQTGETAIKAIGDGAVELYHNNIKTLNTETNGISVTNSDAVNAYVSVITQGGTAGHLYGSNDGSGGDFIALLTSSTSYGVISKQAGATELYYDAAKKFETSSTGTTTSGISSATSFTVNSTSGAFNLPDTAKLNVGSGSDLQIYHDGNDSYIDDAGVGSLLIRTTTNSNVSIKSSSSFMAKFMTADAVELYHNGSKKFETTSSGAKIDTNADDAFVINTSASNGPHIRFAYNNLNYHFIGSAPGIAAGGDYQDLAIRFEDQLFFNRNGTNFFIIDDTAFYPNTNNSKDLGSTSKRFRNIYTNDLNLSNEGGSNDVDGTWGSYTIQEGAEDLFLVNKRNGKKYKFNLTEVS